MFAKYSRPCRSIELKRILSIIPVQVPPFLCVNSIPYGSREVKQATECQTRPNFLIYRQEYLKWAFQVTLVGKNPLANEESARGWIPGSGRFPGVGNGNLFQYSCLENSIDRRVWWAIVHGPAKSWTQLTTSTIYELHPTVFISVHVFICKLIAHT